MLQSQQLLSSNFAFSLSSHPHNPSSLSLFSHSSSPPLTFPSKPITIVSARLRTRSEAWLAQVPEPTPTLPPPPPPSPSMAAAAGGGGEEEGPIELPFSTPSIFADSDDPSPLQVATSVMLTGAISIFLFRSLRRRAKRVKETKFRSSGTTKKSLKEEAMDSLKAMAPTPVDEQTPPSPIQALLGGISAGLIALILYKFATTVEAGLNRQTLSDNFSVRQITITVRTIINGLCYLATFVFGINSVGLVLYSGQLAFNSFMKDSPSKDTLSKDETQSSSTDLPAKNTTNSVDTDNRTGEQSSDKTL